MGIIEGAQALTFDQRVAVIGLGLTAIGVAGGLLYARRGDRRAEEERKRLDSVRLKEGRAILALEGAEGVNRGAAIHLYPVVHEGPLAGQHFTARIQNTGPHMAEGIRASGSLGALPVESATVPRILAPHSALEPFDLFVPFRGITYADVMATIRRGERLRVRVDFTGGTPAPAPFEQCFVFRLEEIPSISGRDWVSYLEPCDPCSVAPLNLLAPLSSQSAGSGSRSPSRTAAAITEPSAMSSSRLRHGSVTSLDVGNCAMC